MMERNTWTIEQFGGEHNARAEALAAEELRAARFRALDEAGPCELCGWSGTMVVYDYRCPGCGAEGVPLTGLALGWVVCVNAACYYRVADLDARCRCADCGREMVRAYAPWVPGRGWVCYDCLVYYVGCPIRLPNPIIEERI